METDTMENPIMTAGGADGMTEAEAFDEPESAMRTTAQDATATGPLDVETLARATLTFCLDGAEAMMVGLLKGCADASQALALLDEANPNHTSQTSSAVARNRLKHTFATGITRWGRSVTPQGMKAFSKSVARWHARLDELPSRDPDLLAAWFTMDGAQWIIAPHHACWPERLEDLAIRTDWAPPLCLWGRGSRDALVCCDKPMAVVGSRGANDYGRHVARELGIRAAMAGHTVVSGGAMGVDAAAHWGALQAGAGRTVAVFAGGLNHIGPSRNLRLFEDIAASGGALISELCPGTIPEARRFLLRNRIIAALSGVTVVAQARLRSGALNTAGWACELGREVYAVPGDIDSPANAGCNKIIYEAKATILPSLDEVGDILHPGDSAPSDGHSPPAGGTVSSADVPSSDETPPAAAKPVHRTFPIPDLRPPRPSDPRLVL